MAQIELANLIFYGNIVTTIVYRKLSGVII